MQRLKERGAKFLAKTYWNVTGIPALGALADRSPDIADAFQSLRLNSQRARLGAVRSCQVARSVCKSVDDLARPSRLNYSTYQYQAPPTTSFDWGDKASMMRAAQAGVNPSPQEIVSEYQRIYQEVAGDGPKT